MTMLSAHFKVADYPKWRTVFDSMDGPRRKAGLTSIHVFRSASDPKEITVHAEWPSIDQAKAWWNSPERKAGMQNAGVISEPDVVANYLESL